MHHQLTEKVKIMIDLIIAILLYIGAISSSSEVNQTVIEENQEAIEFYSNDPAFMEYYNTDYQEGTVLVMDIKEEG